MDGPGLVSLAAGINFGMPQLSADAWLQLIVMIVALVLCAVASASETALTSISRIKLKNLVEEGDKQAEKIERLLRDPNTFLSTILVVNSVAVIVASSMATALALQFSATLGELISTLLISLIVLIFCEITPKTTAVQSPLRWARVLVNFVLAMAWLLRPIVVSLNVITSVFVRLMGGRIKHHGPFVTEEELRLLVTVGEKEGVLEEEETEMIHSIFEFADTTVHEVMVPRIDMVTLPDTATVNEAVDLALQGGFSRTPVYEASVGVDEIIGILYTKDMLKQLRESHDQTPIRNLVRPAYFVPETKKLDDLLREIRQSRTHMAIVIDEYGSVAGLVTIEDLMEEIVGDIQDEYDHEEVLCEKINDEEYICNAKISIHDFNELMGLKLEDVDYETLGGFVYAQLDKIPVVGDTISFEDLLFTVLATRGRRILKVRVVREQKQIETSENKGDVLLLPPPQEREKRIAQKDADEAKQVETSSASSERYEYRRA
jgi:CBS domain containing-hemolysin-like protein